MNWRKYGSTLGLVACATALGAFAYVDRTRVSDAERKERENDVFPAYRRQDVNRIELVQGGVRLAFEKRLSGDAGDTTWQMTSPRDEPADAAAVDKLLGDVEFAGIVRKVDPAAAAGLGAPRVVGALTMGGLVYHFALGAAAPTPEGAAYFRLDGEGTFVVSRDFATSLLKAPDAYRERTVVPYLSLEIERLAVKGDGEDFTIERMDEVSFRLPELGLRASRETLDRVWGALGEGRAESFLEDEAADRAIALPLAIEMTPRDRAKKDGALLIGGVCPGHPDDVVMIRQRPTRLSACVPKGILPGLRVTPAELVDKRLFAAAGDEIAELVLEPLPSGPKVEIARKESGWHERSPADRDLASDEVDEVNALAASLAKGEALDVTRADPNAPFEARARVRIQRGEAKGEETVELGSPSPSGGALVKRLADGAILRVSDALARRLVPSPIALRGKQVFLPPLEGKVANTIETQCDGRAQKLSRDTNGWSLQKPAGYVADSPGAADLVNVVARADAEAWISEGDDGSFGFDKSACSITLGYADDEGGARTVGIVFGREAEPGEYFARPLGQPGVFLAPRSLHDEALRVLIDRSGFHVDSAEVETLALARGGSRLVLSRREGKLDVPGGGRADLGEKIALALDALRADDVVHLGPPAHKEGFAHPSLDVRIRMRGDAGAREVHFVVGDSALILRERMFYARLDGIDATFAVARDRIAPLLDAL